MNRLWCYHLLLAVIVFLTSKVKGEDHEDDTVDLPEDFIKYVQQLGASVFKVTVKSFDTHIERHKPIMKTKNVTKIVIKQMNDAVSNSAKSTQHAALKDILMLKLVSYYEDKYKLSRIDVDTTTTHATAPLSLESLFGNDAITSDTSTHWRSRKDTAVKRTIARRRTSNVKNTSRYPRPRLSIHPTTPRTMYENAAEVVVI